MKLYYHDPCMDGFTAAWVFHCVEEYNEAEFFPLTHTTKFDLPGKIERGETVTFVDITPPAEVITSLLERDVRVYVYDHHVSEEKLLESFDSHENFHYVYDVTHSGAGIAWKTWHVSPTPDLVAFVQDRDLWKWELPGTREYMDGLYLEDRTFERWDELVASPHSTERLLTIGTAVGKGTKRYIESMLPHAIITGTSQGKVAVINAPYLHVSDVLNRLLTEGVRGEKVVAAVSWSLQEDGVSCSIRGDIEKTGVDVSVIAKKYGGGGHKNAAGFRFSDPRQFFASTFGVQIL